MPPSDNSGMGTPVNKPRPHDCAPPAGGVEDSERTERYRRTSGEAKFDGTGIRKSESLVVPVKSGNLTEGTRGREGEAGSWTRREER